MSNPLAIAAVTATLKKVLLDAIEPATVTTLPLDRAAVAPGLQRVNLFLYQTTPNAAYRNMDLPPPGKGNPHLPPLLALNLHYLLTAYGDDPEIEADHVLLGKAMRALHDNSQLRPDDIVASTRDARELARSDLHQQSERLHLTQEVMALDELSKLWAAFQTQYRISVAYQVSAVLIESEREHRSVLPVLMRGEHDRGPVVAPMHVPRLVGIEYRDVAAREAPLPAARPGDIITLFGEWLGLLRRIVAVYRLRSEPPLEGAERLIPLALESRDDRSLQVRLDPESRWVCGALELSAEYENPRGQLRRTEPLRLAVAPQPVVSAGGLSSMLLNERNRRLLRMTLQFPPRPNSEVFLVLTRIGGVRSPAPIPFDRAASESAPTSPVFDVTDVPRGRYRVRVRVDDVDSLLMDRARPQAGDDEAPRLENDLLEFDSRLEVEL